MATFNNGESGSSVRAKINAVLQHADGTAGEIVFNDAGADVDFRIESDTNANAIFMDGATGNVGIGTNSPIYDLQVGSYGVDTDSTLALASSTTGTCSIRFGDGTAGAAANAGRIQYDHSIDAMTFSTNVGAERMRIDASGNLGLGVTPSAWASSVRALETTTGAFYSFASGSVSNFYMMSNSFVNSGGTPTYKQSAAAAQYLQTAGQHQWYTAPSGTAGAAITFTQAMTLDASGKLLIGTTASGGSKLRISGLPTSSAGLSAGDVWNDGGTLKIV